MGPWDLGTLGPGTRDPPGPSRPAAAWLSHGTPCPALPCCSTGLPSCPALVLRVDLGPAGKPAPWPSAGWWQPEGLGQQVGVGHQRAWGVASLGPWGAGRAWTWPVAPPSPCPTCRGPALGGLPGHAGQGCQPGWLCMLSGLLLLLLLAWDQPIPGPGSLGPWDLGTFGPGTKDPPGPSRPAAATLSPLWPCC